MIFLSVFLFILGLASVGFLIVMSLVSFVWIDSLLGWPGCVVWAAILCGAWAQALHWAKPYLSTIS